MTELAVVACVALVGLVASLIVLVVAQARERKGWTTERRELVDRAIARHTGEVISIERARHPRTEREQGPLPPLEGLS